jgi:hypothetical protein
MTRCFHDIASHLRCWRSPPCRLVLPSSSCSTARAAPGAPSGMPRSVWMDMPPHRKPGPPRSRCSCWATHARIHQEADADCRHTDLRAGGQRKWKSTGSRDIRRRACSSGGCNWPSTSCPAQTSATRPSSCSDPRLTAPHEDAPQIRPSREDLRRSATALSPGARSGKRSGMR